MFNYAQGSWIHLQWRYIYNYKIQPLTGTSIHSSWAEQAIIGQKSITLSNKLNNVKKNCYGAWIFLAAHYPETLCEFTE